MLAHPYGEPRIMSSYFFNHSDQGPPADSNENIVSPSINSDDTCGNGWVCEHRWRQIYQMVAFRNAVKDTQIKNWWNNGNNQIAFSRGKRQGNECSGTKVSVNNQGKAQIYIPSAAEDMHLAIHVGKE
ncbi:hypothetical protein MSG28_010128, partial [Choristoneura fumiferana]